MAVIAGIFVAVELAVSARYGIHRDELYFLAGARHLAWGYVDQPPFVPFVARVETALFGTSAVALRLLPALAGGVVVCFTALMARELGGGRRSQVVAALSAAASAEVLATMHLLSTAAFDLFFWAAVSLMVVRMLRTGEMRWWLAIGAVGGIGLLNKYNLAFLFLGLAVGLAATRRLPVLVNRWSLAGAAMALALFAPNIAWNATHHWAALSMLHSLHQENSGLGASLVFIPAQLVIVGPVLAVVWIGGLLRLLRHPSFRALGIAFLTLLVLDTLLGAKPYYLGGIYFVLFAAGGLWIEERSTVRHRKRGPIALVAAMVVGALVVLPLTLPVLPGQRPGQGVVGRIDQQGPQRDRGMGQLRPSGSRRGRDLAPGATEPSGRVHRRLRSGRSGRPLRTQVRPSRGHQRAQYLLVLGTGEGRRRFRHHRRRPEPALSGDDLRTGGEGRDGHHPRRGLDRGTRRPDLDLFEATGPLGASVAGGEALRVTLLAVAHRGAAWRDCRAPAVATTRSSSSSGDGSTTALDLRIPSAVSAPRTDNVAATANAGRYPLVTPAGPVRLPLALKTAATMAMPTTAPNCCIVLSVPAPFPSIAGGRAFKPAAVTQGSAIEIPVPAITKGRM